MYRLGIFNALLFLSQIIIGSTESSESSQSSEESDENEPTFFYMLFTRENPSPGYRITLDNITSLSETSFDPKKPTKICIHGYLSNWEKFDEKSGLRNNYLTAQDVNVIFMDWSSCTKRIYPKAVSCIPDAGEDLAQVLKELIKMKNSPDIIHIVGFSLGAHIAGHGASKQTPDIISRITALDAAKPLLDDTDDSDDAKRALQVGDARFVDAIHTDSGMLGTTRTFDVDFYPNNGHKLQRGCIQVAVCSHTRAYIYFSESIISPDGFYAVKCDNEDDFEKGNCDENEMQLMGEYVDTSIRGKYYLDTYDKEPFARGKNIRDD